MEKHADRLSLEHGSRAAIARNTLWMLVANFSPIVLAVFAIPWVLHGLGASRFGILMLIWALLGYLSALDLGMGRALTQAMSERFSDGRPFDPGSIFCTALVITWSMGIAVGLALAGSAHYIADYAISIADIAQDETIVALRLVAAVAPFVISGTVIRGVVEAHQRFRIVSVISMFSGALNLAGLVIAISISPRLDIVVGVLVGSRIVNWILYVAAAIFAVRGRARIWKFDRLVSSALLSYGGWITLSNVLSPIMSYSDRFLIAALMSATAAAYYVTPYEVVSRGLIVATTFGAVLFPAICRAQDNLERLRQLFGGATKVVFLAMFLLALAIVTLGPPALDLWLGEAFAQQAGPVLQILSVGLLLNGVGQIPYAVLQGIGRPDITAKLHVIEFPLYIVTLYYLTLRFGIDGAAVAWVLRVSLDSLLLLATAGRLIGSSRKEINTAIAVTTFASIGLACAFQAISPIQRVAAFLSIGATFMYLSWRMILLPDDKALLTRLWVTRNIYNPGVVALSTPRRRV